MGHIGRTAPCLLEDASLDGFCLCVVRELISRQHPAHGWFYLLAAVVFLTHCGFRYGLPATLEKNKLIIYDFQLKKPSIPITNLEALEI